MSKIQFQGPQLSQKTVTIRKTVRPQYNIQSAQSSPQGEGVPWYENRRWDWQQRRGHADLYCQHTSAWMHRQVKAVEGIPNCLHTKLFALTSNIRAIKEGFEMIKLKGENLYFHNLLTFTWIKSCSNRTTLWRTHQPNLWVYQANNSGKERKLTEDQQRQLKKAQQRNEAVWCSKRSRNLQCL